MSKLDELIDKFCPNGVEYKEIRSISTVLRGKRLTKNQLFQEGQYPVFHGGLEPLGYYNEKNRDADTVMIINVGASAGTVGYSSVDFWSSDGCFCISHSEQFINRYLYYAILCQENYLKSRVRVAGIPTLDSAVVEKLKIPVPPLLVQSEIVRILDNFTNLSSELALELSARKKQYEYYKQLLMTFNNTPLQKLGNVCKVQSGGTPSKANSEYWNGSIKWLGSTICQNQKTVENVTGYITQSGLEHSSAKLMQKETTLIALVGATIGKVAFLPFDATINQNIAGVFPLDTAKLNPSFVYYACSMLYDKFINLGQGKLAMANMSFVRNLQIPVPPIEEQQRIVDILDRFDKLCNDISDGLPAEIEARKKQYEYYRDKLLAFKPCDCEKC